MGRRVYARTGIKFVALIVRSFAMSGASGRRVGMYRLARRKPYPEHCLNRIFGKRKCMQRRPLPNCRQSDGVADLHNRPASSFCDQAANPSGMCNHFQRSPARCSHGREITWITHDIPGIGRFDLRHFKCADPCPGTYQTQCVQLGFRRIHLAPQDQNRPRGDDLGVERGTCNAHTNQPRKTLNAQNEPQILRNKCRLRPGQSYRSDPLFFGKSCVQFREP